MALDKRSRIDQKEFYEMLGVVPPTQRSKRALLIQALYNAASAGKTSTLAARSVMSSPPTITANGVTAPAGNTNAYNWNTFPGLFRQSGGTPLNSSSGIRRFQALVVNPTGGNIGNSTIPGASGDVWRVECDVDASAPSFRVGVVTSTAPYRFIVDGQYANLTGIATLSSSGSYEYITLDFGSRARRRIIIEGVQNGGFDGVYVGPTESVACSDASNIINGVVLGDSYAQGAAATVYGDGVFMRMADYLGWRSFMPSGSGGTGWQTNPSTYRFGDRIINGDLSLNGAPDVIGLMGSYNDRNAVSQDLVQTPALAGMIEARRQYPNALIAVFGTFAGGTGPSAGILQAEAAMLAAYNQFADPFSIFVPVSDTIPKASIIYGTGGVGATTNNGNADIYVETAKVHLNDAGCGYAGWVLAQKFTAALDTKFGMTDFA